MSSSDQPTARLICEANADHVEISILDGALNPLPLAHNLGRVEVEVPLGGYIVRFQAGQEQSEQMVLVTEAGRTYTAALAEPLWFATSAPVEKTRTTRETQRFPARDMSLAPPTFTPVNHSGGAHLLLFVRDPDGTDPYNPGQGVSLSTIGGFPLLDLAIDGQVDPHAFYAGLHASIDPGAYLLQVDTGRESRLRQVVYIPTGWQTQAFLLTRTYGQERRADLARLSLLMARPAAGFDPAREDLYQAELALKALQDNSAIPGEQRREMLWQKFENPMLGIFGAHLHLRRPRLSAGYLEKAFHNLLGLVGPLPDVLAIGWGLLLKEEAGELEGTLVNVRPQVEGAGPILLPPMLRAGWDYLARASYRVPGLIPPGSLAERVAGGRLVAGPWLSWHETGPPGAPPGTLSAAGTPEPTDYYERLAHEGVWSKGEGMLSEAELKSLLVYNPAGGERQTLEKQIEKLLDRLIEVLRGSPSALDRLYADDVPAEERYLAQLVVPEADPLSYRLAQKGYGARREPTLPSERPNALTLMDTLQLPASRLLELLLRLLSRLTG